jgi:methionyl-tRNA formyltransferase
LGVSFLYNYLIPAEQIKNHVWVNFHPAPLPEYRGRNVGYQSILNNEKEFGATLHYADETFDTGDIIAVKYFPIRASDHAGNVTENARNACLHLFYEWMPRLLKGEKPQGFRQMGGTYYKKKPIDPNVSLTSEQQRLVRAITAPPHFAETTIGGIKYVIKPKSECHHPDDESSGVVTTNTDWAV